ncbi:MAG: Mut7-C RNAse domain-containing protein [Gallionellaceae bacterium]|nr:Mut7-C RNAse domain-containing protein [Gallionellaceae bacterium]
MKTRPRFLCDEMLGRFCRYLRAAGYDTLLASNGQSDSELLHQCRSEGRYFLTCDQLVREHKVAQGVALILPHADLDQLAAMLAENFEMDWVSRAFTRCLVDNALLLEADEAARKRVPPDVRQPHDQLLHCPQCGRVYWRGSHHKRISARLAKWHTQKSE